MEVINLFQLTCKPKHVYPSSATNWANDLFANRYLFRNEHEMSLQGVSETTVLSVDESLPYLIGNERFCFSI